MKEPAPPGFCCRCKYQPATHSHECRKCHYTTLCLTVVHSIWKEHELEGLAERLSKASTTAFIEESRAQGAYLRTKLGNTIQRLAHPAGMSPDELKRNVVSEIRKYLGEMEGIRKYESKPGNEGSWMAHWDAGIELCKQHVRKLTERMKS